MISVKEVITSLSFIIMTCIGASLAYADHDAQGNYTPPVVITPDKINWSTFNAFPPGAKAAFLTGDPRKPGYFALRVKIPPNYKVPPNWQTVEIFVTVLSGSYSIGVGNNFNPKNGKTLPSTGSVVIPADSHLYFWSKKGAILEIHGVGPWDIHYVNPADDPRNRH